MSATILAIADAVVAQLNAGSFGQPLTAVRHYQPVFDLAQMVELKVSVVPRSITSRRLDRDRQAFEYRLDVAVQQKVEPTPALLDPLMALVEQIADHFRTEPLAGYPAARCTEVSNEPVYAAEHLDELRQFTSVLTLAFAVWR